LDLQLAMHLVNDASGHFFAGASGQLSLQMPFHILFSVASGVLQCAAMHSSLLSKELQSHFVATLAFAAAVSSEEGQHPSTQDRKVVHLEGDNAVQSHVSPVASGTPGLHALVQADQ
jgi:hypothetical protein